MAANPEFEDAGWNERADDFDANETAEIEAHAEAWRKRAQAAEALTHIVIPKNENTDEEETETLSNHNHNHEILSNHLHGPIAQAMLGTGVAVMPPSWAYGTTPTPEQARNLIAEHRAALKRLKRLAGGKKKGKKKAKPLALRSIKPAPRALEIINPEEPKP